MERAACAIASAAAGIVSTAVSYGLHRWGLG